MTAELSYLFSFFLYLSLSLSSFFNLSLECSVEQVSLVEPLRSHLFDLRQKFIHRMHNILTRHAELLHSSPSFGCFHATLGTPGLKRDESILPWIRPRGKHEHCFEVYEQPQPSPHSMQQTVNHVLVDCLVDRPRADGKNC